MKRLAKTSLIAFLIPLCTISQITEPPRNSLSEAQYIAMVIDSLYISEKLKDTTNIIRYSSVLTTEFQSARMIDRGAFYLKKALLYATNYSDPSLFPEVCNRAGMLVQALRISNDSLEYDKLLDSSRYWYQRAVKLGLKQGKYGTVGWAYRGLLVNTTRFNNGDQDSIPFYFNEALKIADQTEDLELQIACNAHYIKHLIENGDLENANLLFAKQKTHLDKMTQKQKLVYYSNLESYFIALNKLDTLNWINEKIQKYNRYVTVADHDEQLYAKDQQYEVSKTKETLTKTEDKLKATSKALWISIIGIILFALLLLYIFFLFRKNKRLSFRNKLLLKEQNHRVKNNLQMINSLLSLQSQKLLSTDAKEALNESQLRINSVALLHRMLYEGENVGMVNIEEYLSTLTDEIKYAVPREIILQLQGSSELNLSIEKATSLGLIINELMTNSIKHVDERVQLGIKISLQESGNQLILSYADNGSGISKEAWNTSKSFGNQLIKLQSEQLRGSYEIINTEGFKYELKIGA